MIIFAIPRFAMFAPSFVRTLWGFKGIRTLGANAAADWYSVRSDGEKGEREREREASACLPDVANTKTAGSNTNIRPNDAAAAAAAEQKGQRTIDGINGRRHLRSSHRPFRGFPSIRLIAPLAKAVFLQVHSLTSLSLSLCKIALMITLIALNHLPSHLVSLDAILFCARRMSTDFFLLSSSLF